MLHLRVICQKLGAGPVVTHYVVPCLIDHGILNALFIYGTRPWWHRKLLHLKCCQKEWNA
jgi:hypothetical protein